MGNVVQFEIRRRRVAQPLPVALAEAWSAYCYACSAAWWRWVLTGR